jgi:hypothetical protein
MTGQLTTSSFQIARHHHSGNAPSERMPPNEWGGLELLGLVLSRGGGIPSASMMGCGDLRGVIRGRCGTPLQLLSERRLIVRRRDPTSSTLRVLALRPLTPLALVAARRCGPALRWRRFRRSMRPVQPAPPWWTAIRSARCSRRISAQSSTLVTLSAPWRARTQGSSPSPSSGGADRGVNIRPAIRRADQPVSPRRSASFSDGFNPKVLCGRLLRLRAKQARSSALCCSR